MYYQAQSPSALIEDITDYIKQEDRVKKESEFSDSQYETDSSNMFCVITQNIFLLEVVFISY